MPTGVELAVRRWGPDDGDAFVLVHGLASNARMWDGVAADLGAAGHPVVAVDQRGHGLSDKPGTGYGFDEVSADLAALIEVLRLDGPVVVGQSWGGDVVLELAARRPELLRGVVGIDGGWTDLAARFPRWDECARELAPPDLVGTALLQLVELIRADRSDWPESGIAGLLACFEVRGDGTVAPWLTRDRHMEILRALWERRPALLYPRVAVPALLVPAGSRDDAGSRAEWQRAGVEAAASAVPRCRVRWLRGHHDVHAQRPHEVACLLQDALEDGTFA